MVIKICVGGCTVIKICVEGYMVIKSGNKMVNQMVIN